MPASPSLHSDGRGKWKRQKRHRRNKTQQPNGEDSDEEALTDNNNNNNENSENPRHNSNHCSTEATEVVSDSSIPVCDFPSVVKRVVNRPHLLVTAIVEGGGQAVSLENVSYGQLQAKSYVPTADCGGSLSSSSVLRPPRIGEANGVVKPFGGRVLVLPMHSDWFSPSTLHRMERQVVPRFFSGKSPDHSIEKYIECRNCIVAKYMENPWMRLTIANCQGLVTGVDNEDVTRIFRFLESWGIINYCADASNHEIVDTESFLKEDPNGEVHVSTAALKSIDGLIKFDRPICKLKSAEIYSSPSSKDDDVADLENKLWEQFSENYCLYCSKPVPIVYYQSQKEVDIVLCSHCFHEGRFVIGHSSLDFVRVDSTNGYSNQDGDSWSSQETMLLLEAIEMYNENWNEIAEHVGSKSIAQCILHFIRLPVEEGLLENIEVAAKSVSPNVLNKDDWERSNPISNGNSKGSFLEDVDSQSSIPFAKAANPVMTLVAFLTSAVGPRIAAACAHAALAVLSEDDGSSTHGHDNRMNPESIRARNGGSHGKITNSIQQEEEGTLHGSRGQNGVDAALLVTEKVKAAARAGTSAAAMKAKMFANHEEREIQRLSANIINQQLRRLEMKLKQLAELETLLMKECEQVERTRQRLAAERVRTISAKFGSTGAVLTAGLSGGSPAVINNAVSNRQQVMSSSPSQASISGYGAQPIHPHMSFMPRQQSPLYGFGPRLPVTAIQSSKTASNVLFNPPGNTRPAVNNPILRHMSGASSSLN